jgi:hypothetical protein
VAPRGDPMGRSGLFITPQPQLCPILVPTREFLIETFKLLQLASCLHDLKFAHCRQPRLYMSKSAEGLPWRCTPSRPGSHGLKKTNNNHLTRSRLRRSLLVVHRSRLASCGSVRLLPWNGPLQGYGYGITPCQLWKKQVYQDL